MIRQLGYPRTIAYRREIYPNLVHADYWRRLWQTRSSRRAGRSARWCKSP